MNASAQMQLCKVKVIAGEKIYVTSFPLVFDSSNAVLGMAFTPHPTLEKVIFNWSFLIWSYWYLIFTFLQQKSFQMHSLT